MSGRGKGDPMAGLLSNLGGIDPNLFNKPTMGQLKNKQQPAVQPPKPSTQAPRSDTIAAVGSPARSDAGPSDSFSSQKTNAAKRNPEGQVMDDDLDSFFGSAKPSAAPSNAGSYAPSPANMASPAASLGVPDNQQDADVFGNFGSATQKASASSAHHGLAQQSAMDPFDLFEEGSTVPASAAAGSHQEAASQQAGADDDFFGGAQGSQGVASPPATKQGAPAAKGPGAQRANLVPSRSPKSVTSPGQTPTSQGRSQLPRRSSSFSAAGSPDSQRSAQDFLFTDSTSATDRQATGRGTPGSSSGRSTFGRQGSTSSLDTTAGVQGSPATSASPIANMGTQQARSGLGKPQRTPSMRSRRLSDEGQGSRKGPLEEGASAVNFGDQHPDPYMHDDPYVGGKQSGSSNVEQTAKQWLTGGQKWLKSAGKKLATAAKESASEIQKRLETVDMKRGKGTRVGDDGEEVAAYYHQWAAKIQDMSPARQADVLDQLGEEDRLIVQRILDSAAVKRSNSGTRSGFSHSPSQQARTQPAIPTGSFDSCPPPSYQEAAGAGRAGNSRPAGQPVPAKQFAAAESRQAAQAVETRASTDAVSGVRREGHQKPRTAAEFGVFGDLDNASSSELEQQDFETTGASPRAAESRPAESAKAAAAQAPAQQSPKKQQVAAEADFLGFGNEEAAQEVFMPESPPAESSGRSAAQNPSSFYPPPPGSDPNPTTPDGLADFFSAPAAGPSASSSGAAHTPSSTAHIDDMFSAAPKPKAAAAAAVTSSSAQSSSSAAASSRQSQGSNSNAAGSVAVSRPKAPPKAVPTSMIDFGDEAALLAENPDLYKGLEEVPGEPAYRKELRQKRLRDMHQRMQAQLAEKLARDAAESTEKEEKVDLRSRVVKPKIDAWTQGKKDNIRALLSTLHTVLWEGSGWKPPQMTDLVEAGKVKKQYMKANLIIHPDKVKQKGGTVEQIVIADMAFDVLKTAWAKFESGELRK